MEEELDNMLPDELEKIEDKIKQLLIKLGVEKVTNQKYQLKCMEINCPNCGSDNIVKNGHKNLTQRFKCKNCNKYFSITNRTITFHSKLDYNTFKTIIKGIVEVKTLNEIALETKLSEREVYNIRIKIISTLRTLDESTVLKDTVEADEKYIRLSFKGTRKENMPRKSRKNGFQDLKPGISKEQVCIVGAIDSCDNIILKVVGLGPASTNMIEKALGNKIQKESILVTDNKSSYIKFAQDNKLTLKQIPTGKHKIEYYHLGELNSLFGELELFLKKFRGLSTRHIQEYLDWFRYLKILKYTIEYLNREEETFGFVITKKINLSTRDVCKISMPVDISEIYDDIHQHFAS